MNLNLEGLSSEEKRCSILTRFNETADQANPDLRTIALLQRQYNETIDQIERATRVDLLQKLPPEVSLRCIQESLPDSESVLKSDSLLPDINYTQQLLDFTMVSTRWQDFLTSAGSLWACIAMWAGQEDSMATMALFLKLSGSYSLHLTIWDAPVEDWDQLKVLLAPHQQRIRNVDFRDIYRHTDKERFSLLYFITRSLPDIPPSSNVDLGDSLQLTPGQLELVMGNTEGYILHGAEIIPSPLPRYRNIHSRLGKIVIRDSPSQVGNLLDSMVHLSSIWMIPGFNPRIKPFLTGPSVLSRGVQTPPSLTCLISHSGDRISDQRWLDVVASASCTLTHLEIQAPLPRLRELLDCLASVIHLKELEIRIECNQDCRHFPGASTPYNPIQGLEKLTLRGELLGDNRIFTGVANTMLVEAFTILYPSVKSLQMKQFDLRECRAEIHSYLESLEFLEYLEMSDVGIGTDRYLAATSNIRTPINLRRLRRLNCEPGCMHYLHAPNLEWLSTSTAGRSLGTKNFPSIVEAYVHIYQNGPSNSAYCNVFPLHAGTHVALEYLTLEVPLFLEGDELPLFLEGKPNYYLQGQISSFPYLKGVTVASRGPLDQNATLLCLGFLYCPGDCPVLEEIELTGFPEWDIMMLMLERRNFRTDGVRRISNLKVPLVPPLLQSSVASLLRGKYCERPSNKDICAETTVESLCSPDTRGCIFCVKNMIPGCKVEVVESDGPFYRLDSFYRDYPEPPPSLPLNTLLWLRQQNERMHRWQQLWATFGDTYKRGLACARYLSNEQGSVYRPPVRKGRTTSLRGSSSLSPVPTYLPSPLRLRTRRQSLYAELHRDEGINLLLDAWAEQGGVSRMGEWRMM